VIGIAGAAVVLTGSLYTHRISGSPLQESLPALPSSITEKGYSDETSLRIAASADSSDPSVKNFISSQIPSPGQQGGLARICDLWENISRNWHYVPDPGPDNHFQPADVSLRNNFTGNCLDFAILNAAVIKNAGGEPRIVIAYDTKGEGHAYPEVYMGNSLDEIQEAGDYLSSRYNGTPVYWHITREDDGTTDYWLNLDWQADHPGGPIFADNGSYHASSLSGLGTYYADNGTPLPGNTG